MADETLQVTSALDVYQASIVSKLQTAIPELVDVIPHYGAFNVDDILRETVDSPAAFVCIPTFKPGSVYSNGKITFLAEVMVVLISRHLAALDASLVCRRIMERVLKLAAWNSFGSKAMPPTLMEGNELHYDKLDPMGMAMNVVSWTQEILLDATDDFLGPEQSRMPVFSFPPFPANAADDVTVNDTATVTPSFDAQFVFDAGMVR
jgi:hypothetical protein